MNNKNSSTDILSQSQWGSSDSGDHSGKTDL